MDDKQTGLLSKSLALVLILGLGTGFLILQSLLHDVSMIITLSVMGLTAFACLIIILAARPSATTDMALPVREEEPPSLPAASEAIVAALPDPVLLIDDKDCIIEANPAAQNLLPLLKARQALSLTLRDPDILNGLERVQHSGEPFIVEYKDPSPAKRVFEIRMALALQTPRRVVMLMRDVTEARRIQNMRSDFIANASHELRTPLASMLGFIETLQGPARNDAKAREKFLIIMRDQALRMKRLITDLLSLSHIEMKEHKIPEQALDLKPLIGEVLEALQPLMDEYKAQIQYTPPQDSLLIQGDRDELIQVFQNLIENAIKYGGGEIRIACEDQASKVVFSVQDQGQGIAPEHIPRLTERFYRVNNHDGRKREGTGLGLAIAKHIINRHRGQLLIESRLKQGSRFSVSFPNLNIG
jgi:two-component system, OmpR family, phosphate regulon sensor histidine kinase PhoR